MGCLKMSIEDKIERKITGFLDRNIGYISGLALGAMGVVGIASVGYRIGFEDMDWNTAIPLIKGYSGPILMGLPFGLMNYYVNKKFNDSTS